MPSTPPANDDLRSALNEPGYTPAQRAFPQVFALLADPALGERAEQALLSAGLPAATFAASRLAQGHPAEEAALLRLVGRALRAQAAPGLLDALVGALQSPRPETQRDAAIALGKSGRAEAEPALLACLPTTDPRLLRSVIEALGKVGGARALSALSDLQPPAKLRPVLERALVMLSRTTERGAAPTSENALDVPLPHPVKMVLECRAGLARLLREEAAAYAPELRSPTELGLVYAGSLRPLLELRLALGVAVEWPLSEGSSLAAAVIATLLKPELVATLRAWSSGPLRFRLVWEGLGHRRADTWSVAQGLQQANSPLTNDPTAAPWLVRVFGGRSARLLLCPVAHPELRFAYRTRDVPAASHPTLAAALARVAGTREDDIVWDPFVGSGVELVERAKLGPYRELHGSDLEARALSAARANFESAQLSGVQLAQADARHHRVPGLSLVLSNPPMGRRVLRASGLSGLLCQVVRNVAAQLVPGGRMVWLSPFADATARAAADAGLSVERLGEVDLGGFGAELQCFRKPPSQSR